MSKSYMKEVAELLGVELGEKFVIENTSCNPFYIKEEGLYDCDDDYRGGFLIYLLTGETEIKKTILTERERKYLASVIAPKSIYENVDYIVKDQEGKHFRIIIIDKQGIRSHLPYFAKDNMYKGMEIGTIYTLEELRLSIDES